MTVSTTGSRDVKQGDGSTTDFPTSFQFFQDTALVVTLVDSNGNETLQTLNNDYTVSGGGGSTGTVKMSSAPASTERLVIERQTARTQPLDLVANDLLPAEAIEDVADKLTLLVQEANANIERAALLTKEFTGGTPELPAPDQGKLMVWDANGDLVNTDLSEIDTNNITVTTFGKNLVQQAGADGARTQLEVDDHTKAGDVDASFLEGNSASFYTNITARLGYTPADVAGDTFTGRVSVDLSTNGNTIYFLGTPSGGLSATAQGVRVRQSNSGLGTVEVTDGGGQGSGNLVLQAATLEHDDGSTKEKVLTTSDVAAGWQVIDSGSIPSATASFDVTLPTSGFKKLRLMLFEAEINAAEHPRMVLSDDGGTSFFTDGSLGDEDYFSTFSSFAGSDNHSNDAAGFARITDTNKGGFDTNGNGTLDGHIDIQNSWRGDRQTRLEADVTWIDDGGTPFWFHSQSVLVETQNATDVLRLEAGATTTWAAGTWELWGIPT